MIINERLREEEINSSNIYNSLKTLFITYENLLVTSDDRKKFYVLYLKSWLLI